MPSWSASASSCPAPPPARSGSRWGCCAAAGPGALAAWAGFTLPSALLLTAFAYGAAPLEETAWGAGLLRGLKLAAVAIVAQAVWGMARSLCPDRPRATIAMLATVLACFAPAMGGQLAVIVLGGLAGLAVLRDVGGSEIPAPFAVALPRWAGAACLGTFGVLLAASLLWPAALASGFYRSGALVFGGGHVVLPLLRDAVVTPGRVSESAFLAGYGATQAMPGPVFTFAAYLGAVAGGPPGAVVGLLAIFLPGLLLAAGGAAVLARAAAPAMVAAGDARRECGGGRAAGRGAVRPGVDRQRARHGGFRGGRHRVRAAGDLAGAAAGDRGAVCCGRAGVAGVGLRERP